MKLKPFKEILAMSREKLDETLAPIRAMQAKKKAELKILELEEKMTSKEASIIEMCAKKDIDFDKLVEAQDEYALMERRVKQFQTIITELFPE